MAPDSLIETGVDRLVKLVQENGRISVPDASKQLGISSTVVEEWADFLEQEGIISIEHTFTKPYLIPRKVTKKEAETKAKEFSGKKDVFIRKAESTVGWLGKESDKLKGIKSDFDRITHGLGFDLGKVKGELDELHKYEQMKIELDKKVQEQKKSAQAKLGELSRTISNEHKKYQTLLNEIKQEEYTLQSEKKEASSLEEAELLLKKKIEGIKSTVNELDRKVSLGEAKIKASDAHVEKLKNLAEDIKSRADREKSLIEPLIEKSRMHEKKIMELQKSIIDKIMEKEKKMENAKKASQQFRKIFDKKIKVIGFIDKLNKDRDALEKDLMDLLKKAKSFKLTSKSADLTKEMQEMEKKFSEVDSKKKDFEKEYRQLGESLK
ncbi:hypothetical protein J4212_02005 [Candidatus Woesearchaeota archaeon]|nr:hypothetical protein [Candidatus Woesearchaeota archaeon]